jgi:chromosome segregation ATPase
MTDDTAQYPAPEVFRQLFDLLGLIKDAPACELRLAELRRKHAAIRSAEKRLAADTAAFAEYEKTARAEIEAERAEAGQIYARARQIEAAAEANAPDRKADRERIHELEAQLGMHAGDRDFVRIEGTSFARELEHPRVRTVRTDRHGQEFPAGTSITRSEPSA